MAVVEPIADVEVGERPVTAISQSSVDQSIASTGRVGRVARAAEGDAIKKAACLAKRGKKCVILSGGKKIRRVAAAESTKREK